MLFARVWSLQALASRVALVTAAAMLGACGGLQPPVRAPGALPQNLANARHSARSRSWMLPGTQRLKRLLYASDDETGTVFVYDFKTGKEVGELTGFSSPYGQCVDKRGDVFLTTEVGSAGQVLEYAHGGAEAINVFDTTGHPIGCSIARESGDLAVGVGLSDNSTAVEIWKHASGSPTQYSSGSQCPGMWPPGYDNHGNLYFETGDHSTVCELPRGASTIVAVPFNHYLTFPGSVMWDGRHLAFTDLDASGYNTTAIYQAGVGSNGGLTVVGTTQLNDRRCGVIIIQPFIVGKRNTPDNDRESHTIVGGNLACYNSKIQYWHYPAGGANFESIAHSPQDVVGQSVSIKE